MNLERIPDAQSLLAGHRMRRFMLLKTAVAIRCASLLMLPVRIHKRNELSF